MNKYEITAGLNYLKESTLSESEFLGGKDGKEPAVKYKDSTEADLADRMLRSKGPKGPDRELADKDEGPNARELRLIKQLSGVSENTEDDDLRDEESGKNHDPKTGKRIKPHPFDPGEEELHEGKMKDIISDAHDMSKEEFYKKYPHGEFDYDEILADYPLDEADGSGSYGGQSPLTYDTQRSSKMKEEDDELNEITKLSGLGEARKKRPDAYDDDWDNEDEDEKVEDPDKDKVPHILMQLKKALDVDGDYPIKFLDGSAYKLPVDNINDFIDTYMLLKPTDRENLQIVAVRSKKEFDNIILLINQSTKKK